MITEPAIISDHDLGMTSTQAIELNAQNSFFSRPRLYNLQKA